VSPILKPHRVPLATYRLQFNRDFTFNQAAEIISYLAELGISDVYASPLFLAGPESTHGYDVCNFNQLNPALGTSTDFEHFIAKLRETRLGLLLDIVPNHMGACAANDWWCDVLRHGVESKYARWFDIVWEARPDRKVLLPILGDRYGDVLKQRQLRLDFDGEALYLAYLDKKFPLSPASQDHLKHGAEFKPGDPNSIHALKRLLDEVNDSPEKLHQVIQSQHYRLAYWRVGPYEINYRRFFDVTNLISFRVEDEQAFDAAHELTFDLIKEGKVMGLRVDHPDGLWDPKTYFDRLQSRSRDLFIVAEKILSDSEQLPEDWPIAGTTGYDFLNHLNGVFIASGNEAQFDDIYSQFTATNAKYERVEYESKKHVLKNLFPREVSALTQRFRGIADQLPEGVDFIRPELESALVETIAAFGVYRTYARGDLKRLPSSEESHVRKAVRDASKRVPEIASALQLLERILLLQIEKPAPLKQECSEFVSRFQQLTGPATAKGLEDTAFYRFVRFVSLNEVGGNPGRFGTAVDAFHEHKRHKQQCWPHSQLATATHDTKRGEDLRARLNVLSEIPGEWRKHLEIWTERNRPLRKNEMPSSNDEYLLYQMLVGSWTGPTELEGYIARIQQYMEKATREAKLHTSWLNPNSHYEKATRDFVQAVLRSEKFRATFEPFGQRIAFFAVFNSLGQVLLKSCSPGLPDFYQGTELWDFNLVDPDNRRPVDYNRRKQALARVKNADCRDLLHNAASGDVKMFTTWAALQFRNRHREFFEEGNYIPLHARGSKRDHVIAFAREFDGKRAIAVAPRLCLTLVHGETKPPLGREVWGDTELELPRGQYRNYFTGKIVGSGELAEVLSDFPVALLESI
jgi:(1->4)-alpha-D-glucan 1-alpha-D-glucosylmutase